jgi:hypothetical protein
MVARAKEEPMRSVLLASAATFALILAHPGFAQTTATDTQPRAVGQQDPVPADVRAPTDPTVPAELQAPPPGQPPEQLLRPVRERGGELIDQSQTPFQTAQNQVPPSQDETMPGQPAAPKGPAANQEGQTQPTDAGTPVAPAGPPGTIGTIAPDQTQTPPGHPAAPHGQGSDQEGQSNSHSDIAPPPSQNPIQMADFVVAQNDTTPGQAAPARPKAPMQPQGSMGDNMQGVQSPLAGDSQAKVAEGYNAAGHQPMSLHASNIDQADTRDVIAPSLPTPPGGPNATPAELLHAARDALGRHATGEAQEALERAETRLLDRSTEPGNAGMPDSADAVKLIGDARMALGHHDMAAATQDIDQALQRPAVEHFAAE